MIRQPDGFPFVPWRGRVILLLAVHLVGTAGYMSVMAMAPVIRTDLGLTAADFGFFLSAFFASQVLTALPSGLMTDRFGVGWTLSLAMLMMAVGMGLFAVTPGFSGGVVAMFIMGLGYSLVNPATAKGVLTWYPRNRRATAMGIKQFGVPVGGVVGAGGGMLVVLIDWRLVLMLIAGATLVIGGLWLLFARRPTRDDRGFRGILKDLRAVLGHPSLGIICISNIAFSIGQSSLFAYLTLFLRDAAALSQPLASLGTGLSQAASAGGRIGFSYLSDVFMGGRRKWIIVGLIIAGGASVTIAAFANPGWPAPVLILLAVGMGRSDITRLPGRLAGQLARRCSATCLMSAGLTVRPGSPSPVCCSSGHCSWLLPSGKSPRTDRPAVAQSLKVRSVRSDRSCSLSSRPRTWSISSWVSRHTGTA